MQDKNPPSANKSSKKPLIKMDKPKLCTIFGEKLIDMITFPNAKINLGLNVVERRPDGYHNLETLFYPIPLQDALEVTRARKMAPGDEPYSLHISGRPIEGDPADNLVVKAYRLVKELHPDIAPVDIHMYKHIPTGAGLGGGSADAAFMLCLLNSKFQLGMTEDELERHAARLGADCAFFVRNRPVFATGIGNIFHPVELSLKGFHLVLVKPAIFVSTKAAFAMIRPRRPQVDLREVARMPVEEWKGVMHNDFEDSVFPQFPEIAAIKDRLYDLGAVYASMSGSGSSVFGLFRQPVANVEEKFCECFCRQRAL
jgi:4-diphosphocytidyl-2-C-methyl-D-erythritol kinase